MKKSGFQILLDVLSDLDVGSSIIESVIISVVVYRANKKINKVTIHDYILLLQRYGYVKLEEGLVTILKTINIKFNELRSDNIIGQQDSGKAQQ